MNALPAQPPISGRLIAAALGVFLLGTIVFHEKADFAFFYHTDEPTKVDQLVANSRNYFHPLLLLNTAGLLYTLDGRPPGSQPTVEVGRFASDLFSAAVLALVLIVCVQNAGWIAGLIGVTALLLDSSLYEFAHYFKEDPAMNFGVALFCLAATQYERRPGAWAAVFLGVAAGVTVSGKYIGLLALPFALFVLWAARGPAGKRPAASRLALWLFVGFAAAISLINWQVFFEAQNWLGGFHSEMGRVDDRYGESGSFQFKAWQRIAAAFSPATGLLLIAYLFSPLYRRRRLTPAQWSFFGLLLAFSVLLLSASRTGGRYNSPIILLSDLCAALAAGWIISALTVRFPLRAQTIQVVGVLAFLSLFLAVEAPAFLDCRRNFYYDSRLELVKYIEKNLPPSAFLAEEYDARLPDASKPDHFIPGLNLPKQRYVVPFEQRNLPDAMTMEELRQKGITDVVLVWTSDKKKLAQTDPAQPGHLSDADKKRVLFYHELTTRGTLLWECRGGSPDHVRPALRLYAVPPAAN